MPVTFSTPFHRALTSIALSDYVGLADFQALLFDLTGRRHPDTARSRIVDLSAVTGWSDDFAVEASEMVALDAWMSRPDQQALCIFVAPTPAARDFAALLSQICAHLPGLVSLVVDHEGEALAILGQSDASLTALPTAA